MMSKLTVLALLLACFFMAVIEKTDAYCCKVDGFPIGHPPACNIFGCNCDCDQCEGVVEKSCCVAEKVGLGCPKSRKRHVVPKPASQGADQVFQKADTNGDGAISMEEAIRYLVNQWNMTERQLRTAEAHHWFTELDQNADGKLQPREIDAALVL